MYSVFRKEFNLVFSSTSNVNKSQHGLKEMKMRILSLRIVSILPLRTVSILSLRIVSLLSVRTVSILSLRTVSSFDKDCWFQRFHYH